MKRLGVLIVGLNGAVSSTVIAGVALMRAGLTPRVGMTTEGELEGMFRPHAFTLTDAREVLEWTETYGASARWVERMRDADSMLTALSDEEVAQGLDALRADPSRLSRLELTLLVFTRA